MDGRLPDFLIVGAPKSGTTSLAKWLSDRSDFCLPPEKELGFFDYGFDRGADWYRSRFASCADASLAGEATPNYLGELRAHARMAELVPHARLIAMLRNPVDRAYSHYWHWHERLGELRSFEAAVAEELRHGLVKPVIEWDPAHPDGYSYLAWGRYLEQLSQLTGHFDRSQIHVILFEDLRDQPAEVFADVCRFLAAPPDPIPDSVGSVENAYLYYRPAWLWALLVRIQIGRWVPRRVGAAIWRAMVRQGDRYPPMDAGLRRELTAYFAPANAALGQWLGRDLSAWNAVG